MSYQIAIVAGLVLILVALSILESYRRLRAPGDDIGATQLEDGTSVPGDYLSDAPLDDPATDRFGRRYFAARVAETIASRREAANLVIGIYGRWGSGKTTAMNFIDHALQSDDDVVVESFNPWLFSSTEQLLAEFFAVIAKMLETRLDTPVEKLGGILNEFGKAASGLTLSTGLTGFDPGALLRGAGGLLAGANIRDMKERVARVLREKEKKVVILIDDVDRLDVEETYMLFRLVKLVADFENTTYVLAFDDQVVAAALKRRYPEQEKYGEGFVDKIVQVPLHLPPARLDLVHGLVFEGIDQLLERERVVLGRQEVLRFRRAFDPLATDIDTPRIAARYLNAVLLGMPLEPESSRLTRSLLCSWPLLTGPLGSIGSLAGQASGTCSASSSSLR